MKNCDRGLENTARGRRPRASFSRPRSQFFTTRTDPKPANNLFLFFLRYTGLQVSFRNCVIELAGLKCRLRTIVKSLTCERTCDVDKERCIKEQIYFELLYDSRVASSSPVKFSKIVFLLNCVQSLKLHYKNKLCPSLRITRNQTFYSCAV